MWVVFVLILLFFVPVVANVMKEYQKNRKNLLPVKAPKLVVLQIPQYANTLKEVSFLAVPEDEARLRQVHIWVDQPRSQGVVVEFMFYTNNL